MDTDQTSGDGHLTGLPRIGHQSTVLEKVAEALIFAADEPITAKHIAKVFADVSGLSEPERAEVDGAVDIINALYELSDRALRIERWAGGYRMATTAESMPYLKAFFQKNRLKKLSRSLMETIAIIVYRQPATRTDIEFVRGVDCDYALRKLMEYGLVDVVGRSEGVGRPLLYGTTDVFLELFGLNSVSDLPNLRELEELLDDPSFQKERAKMLMTSGLHQIAPPQSTDIPASGVTPDRHDQIQEEE